jgi:hypothetical protein
MLHSAVSKMMDHFEFHIEGESPMLSDIINATGFDSPSKIKDFFAKLENSEPQTKRYKPNPDSKYSKMQLVFTQEEWLTYLEDWRIIVSKGEHIRKIIDYGNF